MADKTVRIVIIGDSASAESAAKRVNAAFADVDNHTTRLSDRIRAASDRIGDFGRKMTTFVTLPLVGIGVQAVRTAADFEKTMNTVAAVAGVPGPALQKLEKLAIQMGQQTVFSAGEAATAILELSKAGIETSDIMGGALKNTLDLATAGELELGEAANVAARAMKIFGLSGVESQKVVDALAGAANASASDVDELAQALQQGGLAANAAGLSIEDTTAILAAFADQGLRGSDAGTSLKTALIHLVDPSDEASSLMRDLNIQLFDSRGNFVGAEQAAAALAEGFKNLTREERLKAEATIAGTDGMRALEALYKTGAEAMGGYVDKTSEVGTASEVAQGKMEGLPGAIEKFKGSIDTLLLTVGQQLAPIIEEAAGFLADLANGFLTLEPEVQKIVVVVGIAVAAVGPLALAIKGIGLALAALLSPIGLVVAAIGGLVAALVVAWNKSEEFREIVTRAFRAVSDAVAPILDQLRDTIKTWMERIQGFWKDHGDAILNTIKRVWELIEPIVVNGLQMLQHVLVAVLAIIEGDWDTVWSSIRKFFKEVWEQIPEIAKLGVELTKILVAIGFEIIKELAKAAWNWVKDKIADVWEQIKDNVGGAVASVGERIGNGFALIKERISDAMGRIKSNIADGIGKILDFFQELPGKIVDILSNLPNILYNIGKEIIGGLINGIKSMIGSVLSTVGDLAGKIADAKGPIEKDRVLLIPQGRALMQGLARGLKSGFTDLVEPALVGITGGLEGDIGLSPGRGGGVIHKHYNLNASGLYEEKFTTDKLWQMFREMEVLAG